MNHFLVGWRCLVIALLGVITAQLRAQQVAPTQRPNVLLLVADDMNWDSPGCFGGAAPGITPNIDRPASEGMRFWHAHVNIAICTPSRSVMLTGLYPQHNGAEGFQRIRPDLATLPAILSEAGYLCGTVGKPLRQQELFHWSATYRWQGTGDEDRWGRDPAIYGRFAEAFFRMAKASQQPFFLMASSHDPHAPFAGSDHEQQLLGSRHYECAESSRLFRADEVKVPGFLPDLPQVRRALATYCSSVRRLDDMVGMVLRALDDAELAQNTIVIFLSDHGMPFPFAKMNCYVDSTRSPWIIRWPGQIKRGSVDRTHMISAVDLQPTILEALGLPPSRPADGRSFLPLLKGARQEQREFVFTQFNHIHGERPRPMRSVMTTRSIYIFNPWSNGQRQFYDRDLSFESAARSDAQLARRVRHYKYRTVEEFYDLEADPHCLNNLLADGPSAAQTAEQYDDQIALLRSKLREWMLRVKDPAVAAFDQRDSPDAMEQFMSDYTQRAMKEVEALKPYEEATGYIF